MGWGGKMVRGEGRWGKGVDEMRGYDSVGRGELRDE